MGLGDIHLHPVAHSEPRSRSPPCFRETQRESLSLISHPEARIGQVTVDVSSSWSRPVPGQGRGRGLCGQPCLLKKQGFQSLTGSSWGDMEPLEQCEAGPGVRQGWPEGACCGEPPAERGEWCGGFGGIGGGGSNGLTRVRNETWRQAAGPPTPCAVSVSPSVWEASIYFYCETSRLHGDGNKSWAVTCQSSAGVPWGSRNKGSWWVSVWQRLGTPTPASPAKPTRSLGSPAVSRARCCPC